MLFGLEDPAAIGAFAFKDSAGVVQPVAKHMQLGIAPGHETAVIPDFTIALIKRHTCHLLAPDRLSLGVFNL